MARFKCEAKLTSMKSEITSARSIGFPLVGMGVRVHHPPQWQVASSPIISSLCIFAGMCNCPFGSYLHLRQRHLIWSLPEGIGLIKSTAGSMRL